MNSPLVIAQYYRGCFFMKNRASVQLTERDFSIFQLILAQGAKTPSDLAGQFWGSKSKKAKAGFQRIRKLILAGLLQRGNPKLLYLSDEAKTFLARHPGVEEGKRDA